jgi:hypothetical protein
MPRDQALSAFGRGRMAGVIPGLLFAVVPLVCWALKARTARVGWIVAAILAACGAGGLGLAAGWFWSDEKRTLLAALALVTPLVIVFGIAAERDAGAGRSRSGGVRGIAGLVVSVAYLGFSFIVIPLLVLAFLIDGGTAYVPSGAAVLPLPAGLAIAGDQDQGCGSGSRTICSRQFLIVSTAGLPAGQVAQRLRDHLVRVRGWSLGPDVGGGWGGCRSEGWLLDRQQVCVDVYVNQQRVAMLLQGGN